MSSQRLLGRDLTSIPLEPEIEKEFSHWERLVFSFDMQNNDPNNTSNNPQGQPQTPEEIQTAALLAQLAASTGTIFPTVHGGQYPGFPPSHLGSQGFIGGPTNMRSFVSPANLASPPYGVQPYPFSHGNPPPPPQNPPATLDPMNMRARSQPQAGPSTANTAPDDDDIDDYEDKRQRNTAASARFRIKKKQRTLALERTVSDLSGRADELEREAADLRRENGWLKEIVMLKGGRLAGLDLSRTSDTRGQGSQAGASRQGALGNEESDSESSDEQGNSGRKKKGKGKAKKK
ncbi:cytochrome C oxidase assembly protein COX19 [Favolaschia claudopus]|uniref:Cytochrome C oxidase assembly protein COX19 n=1 Tax=Favolaschia claudopus TaxID=2862362 RepID=A0AAW0EK91_9AGAR